MISDENFQVLFMLALFFDLASLFHVIDDILINEARYQPKTPQAIQNNLEDPLYQSIFYHCQNIFTPPTHSILVSPPH
jgi:hypothetical protein